MDPRQYMIVDLERLGRDDMFLTERVVSIKDNQQGYWRVLFSNSRVFRYRKSRLLVLTEPEAIDLKEKGFYIGNKRIDNVVELLCFSDHQYTFYRVSYTNKSTEYFNGKDIYITRTPIDVLGGSTWDYLRRLADETGLQTVDNENILSKQYELIDIKRDNIPLAQFLGSKKKLASYRIPNQIYYPFGCNASQKTAVEVALTHQVSIIQGPPGTGKTQTILNIVANLLLLNKTILIVSNNNSAVENVAEKLQHEGLGFLVAHLGSIKNKEAFISKQESNYPNMTDWVLSNPSIVRQQAEKALHIASQGFEAQTKYAQLKAEYNALITEKEHNDLSQNTEYQEEKRLDSLSTSKLIKLLHIYRSMMERGEKLNFWFRLKWAFLLGFSAFGFLKYPPAQIIRELERAYYRNRKSEIEKELGDIVERLRSIGLEQKLKELKNSSLQFVKNKIAQRYNRKQRPIFTIESIKPQTEKFLREYPIVLSSTYSAKSCISKDMIFDYVIMDEASQIDIKTGALALSCATNAVIVGDDKQLPNVVSPEEALVLNIIQKSCNVDDSYNATTHSFLQSCSKIFKNAPTTLLREHYRCHPKIIEFCNQRFYNGELLTMTSDCGEENVLKVLRTIKGNHARGRFNQREIDVIIQEVMPEYKDTESVGIITPYQDQAIAINEALGKDIASTVHKYQGRECDSIIISTVKNTPTSFSDNDNLLNVAISRAKKQLCIVTTGNEIPQETNLAQLIDYIQYNNCEVKTSGLYSVFDLLYQQYTSERLSHQMGLPQISEHLSENLIYETLILAITELEMNNLSVLCHYPISKLIADWSILDDEEQAFARNPLSHVDFLLYNSITKLPLLAIEVDGWHFHKNNVVQQSRDKLKDQILSKYSFMPLRLSTTDVVTVETMKTKIATLILN